jgi:DNA-binding transcriptional MerR regulator
MEMRVEQLSVRSGLSVDTIRYYQSKGLLDPPRREGRVAWYHQDHLDRLERIRTLQQRGFTLATIVRLVSGDLDAADEALLGELSGLGHVVDASSAAGLLDGPPAAGPDAVGDSERLFTLEELASETGVPLALLKAIEAEGLLIPRRFGGHRRYTSEDVAAARAGLLLLDWGIPLSSLLDLARRHHEATQDVAREAVTLFSTYIRHPQRLDRSADGAELAGQPEPGVEPDRDIDAEIDRLLRAYSELLPAVNALVANHFTRTLVNSALEHVDQVGSDAERRAISDQIGENLHDLLADSMRSDPSDQSEQSEQSEQPGQPSAMPGR